ncbi:MAG: hypothetical protein PVI86_01085 [Phycisphaerae bacterium]|jgi:hypothetical protein
MMWLKRCAVALSVVLVARAGVDAAELSVGDLNMVAGDTATVVVSGDIAGESTTGLTILAEIVTRGGNVGTVEFTAAPPVDIVQLGDAWPGTGTFTPFDTDNTPTVMLNGAVDDNGTFIPGPVTFSGAMVGLPVIASGDADGVWDVFLSTSQGDSSWEALSTTLFAGTITVVQAECFVDLDCDDGVYCNGVETCPASVCVAGVDPCPGQFCSEALGACVDCLVDNDCDDGSYCNGVEPCNAGTCGTGSDPCPGQMCDETGDQCVDCLADLDCDDGAYCNGVETCPAGACVAGADPCPTLVCDEVSDSCIACSTDAECDDGNVCTDDACNAGGCDHFNNTDSCDDGLFCTLTDVCGGGTCVGGGDPCPGQACDEGTDQCIGSVAELSVEPLSVPHGGIGVVYVAGQIANFDTFGVNILVELVPRAGSVGTVTFTAAPPTDVTQEGDPWPGLGTFTAFDTDDTGSPLLNGTLDDNGTFIPETTLFSGRLAGFPVVASSDAGGVWDVVLSTSAGDSGWDGVTTTLVDGTITVAPAVGLSITGFAMPPDAVTDVVVAGNVEGQSTFGTTILVELVPRPSAVGTLTFTGAPPTDIVQLGDPWPVQGTFSPFDTDVTGSALMNGSVDDNGSFIPGPLTFAGDLVAFPVVSSPGADGQWDVTLSTSSGDSFWENLPTVLVGAVITVTADACILDTDCDDANSCTMDVCVRGVCEYTTIVGACDDGDLCTENDTCDADVCVGTPIDCSGLDDQCNVGVCNPSDGSCETAPANEGATCDDGDPCTETDVCGGGVCAGTFILGCINCVLDGDCDDSNDCTDDTCPNGACLFTDISGPCEDGDACTVNDTCVAGVCTPGTARNCNDFNVCTNDSCDSVTGCVNAPNTNPCNDGNACTNSDVCGGGTCAGTLIPGCVLCNPGDPCDDGNACTDDACGANGTCSNANNTDPCDDNDRCTTGDTCSGGACVGAAVDCSGLDDVCNVGVCVSATGLCLATPTNEGGSCNDGLPCTSGDMCVNGVCEGTLAVAPIVDLSWVPSSQTVQVGETVQIDLMASSGTCADQPIASAEVILLWDPGALKLLGRIPPSPLPWSSSGFPNDSALDGLNAPFVGVPASDGDALYQAFGTLPSGVVVPPGGIVVTTFEFEALDGSLGTTVSIPATFGAFSQTRILGAASDIGLNVTGSLGSASVTILECQGAGDCDDSNPCTTDDCVAGVCTYTNNSLPCEDGLFCTTGDTCGGGSCVGGGDPCVGPLLCSESLDDCVECLGAGDCSDGNICTNDVCNIVGSCENPANSLPCDDGLYCTATDVCNGGSCVGGGDPCPGSLVCAEAGDTCVECVVDGDCDDGNVCTEDACLGDNTCQYTPNTLPCEDGDFCTSNDVCSGGVCIGGPDPCGGGTPICIETINTCVQCQNAGHCDDGNVCTTDVCNIAFVCQYSNNALPCVDDALYCNGTGQCSGGVCTSTGDPCPGQLCDEGNGRCVDCFTPGDCPGDGVGCTDEGCDDGVCTYTPNDASCDDGVFCNGPEFCHSTLDCQATENPCDDPSLCNETNDSCGCREPVLTAVGSRYLAATPRTGDTPVALKLTGVDLAVSCLSTYVQPNGKLGPNPVFLPPRGVGGWETVYVSGSDIIPSTSYVLQAECDTGQGMGISTGATDETWVWADADNSGFPVDFEDISMVVDGFRGFYPIATMHSVDLWGSDAAPCSPQQIIDFVDIMSAVDAFRQNPFPCPDPCP